MAAIGAAGYVADQSIAITGNLGSEVFNFAAGTTLADAVDAINQAAENTGVWAYASTDAGVSGGVDTAITLVSTEFGADQFVYVQDNDGNIGAANSGFTAASGGILRDNGQDMTGIIDGQKAQGIGRTLKLSSQQLEVSVTYVDPGSAISTPALAGAALGNARYLNVPSLARINTGNTITIAQGGGAKFQLGKKTNQNEQESFAISRVSADRLGQGGVGWLSDIVSGGQYDLKTNADQAAKVIDEAIKDIATLRGRLGNFQLNVVDTNINSLTIGVENLSAAESNIRNTDFAQATSMLTKQQILVSAGTSVLATANATPQNVLALLT
jgi:flagellin